MMNTLLQGSSAASLASLQAVLGQGRGAAGEEGGFEKLLGAVPETAPGIKLLDAAGITTTIASADGPVEAGISHNVQGGPPNGLASAGADPTDGIPSAASTLPSIKPAPSPHIPALASDDMTGEPAIAGTLPAAPGAAVKDSAAAAHAAGLLALLTGNPAPQAAARPLRAQHAGQGTGGEVAETGKAVAVADAAPVVSIPARPAGGDQAGANDDEAATAKSTSIDGQPAGSDAATTRQESVEPSGPVSVPAATPDPASASKAAAASIAAIAIADSNMPRARDGSTPRGAPGLEKPARATKAADGAQPQDDRPSATPPASARAREVVSPNARPLVSAREATAPRLAGADGGAAMTVVLPQQANAPAPTDAIRPAFVAERLLDMTGDDGWIDQLANDILATKTENGEINFRLMPRHLGRLDVAMRQGDEGVSLKMEAQTEAAATIVGAAQGRLVEELRQQGVRVAGSEVTHSPSEAGRQSQQGQGQGRGQDGKATHLIEIASEHGKGHAERPGDGRGSDRRSRFA